MLLTVVLMTVKQNERLMGTKLFKIFPLGGFGGPEKDLCNLLCAIDVVVIVVG